MKNISIGFSLSHKHWRAPHRSFKIPFKGCYLTDLTGRRVFFSHISYSLLSPLLSSLSLLSHPTFPSPTVSLSLFSQFLPLLNFSSSSHHHHSLPTSHSSSFTLPLSLSLWRSFSLGYSCISFSQLWKELCLWPWKAAPSLLFPIFTPMPRASPEATAMEAVITPGSFSSFPQQPILSLFSLINDFHWYSW